MLVHQGYALVSLLILPASEGPEQLYEMPVERKFQVLLHRVIGPRSPYNHDVRRHFSRSVHLINGRCKRLGIVREITEDLIWCLSEERMNRRRLAEDGCSAIGRRVRHLRTLLCRYARLEPWKEKFSSTTPLISHAFTITYGGEESPDFR